MKLRAISEWTSPHGQLQIDARAVLTEACEMLNKANDGECLLGNMAEPVRITAPAGTEVEYHMQETRTGFCHTVTLNNEHGTFYAKKITDTFRGRIPA